MKSWIWIIILLILIIVIFIGVFLIKQSKKPGEYDEFAQCLTDAGVKMYGTDWCHYCQAQKKLFGSSFKLVNYINCDRNRDICLAEGATRYPDWRINNESYLGVQELKTLANLTDCELV